MKTDANGPATGGSELLAGADDIRRRAASAGQEHLFRFWAELSPVQRTELLADIERIPLDGLRHLVSTHVLAAPAVEALDHITPAEPIAAIGRAADRRRHADARERGAECVGAGRAAALTVAGGQGTRLGFDGPKGILPISPVTTKTLFQLFAEGILAAQRRFGGVVPWYIMTSDATDRPTRTFFRVHGFFGLQGDQVHFFRQGMMPAFGLDGAILLAQKHRVALSPDGHGGVLRALAESGCLADMAARGIEVVSYFQVDNPLVRPVDPILIGLHLQHRAEASSLVIPKADDLERVGNFVCCHGHIRVFEYTELPPELAHARTPDGRRAFDAANLSIYAFSTPFLERLAWRRLPAGDPGSTARATPATQLWHRPLAGAKSSRDAKILKDSSTESSLALPWHRALKRVPCIDLASGRMIEPSQPNGVKLERFIFDALQMTPNVILVESSRDECFSPIKNASGVDSVETARADLNRRAARWLRVCGLNVTEGEDGQPRFPCEISPLAAEECDELSQVLRNRPAIATDGPIYVA